MLALELQIVEDAHRRHDEAHFDRQRPAQRLDLLGQTVGAVGRIDQRQQRIAEFDLEIVHLERGRDRLLGGRRLGGLHLFGLGGDRLLGAAVDQVSQAAVPPPSARNGIIGMPGSSAMTSMTAPDMPSALG